MILKPILKPSKNQFRNHSKHNTEKHRKYQLQYYNFPDLGTICSSISDQGLFIDDLVLGTSPGGHPVNDFGLPRGTVGPILSPLARVCKQFVPRC